jgi:hypothetical protein
MKQFAAGGVVALALLVHAAAAEPVAPSAAAVPPPVPAATDSAGTATLPSTLRENSYFYQSFGTPDPFRSLLAGAFEAKQQQIVDLHTVQLVGVVWEDEEIAAMVQDVQGFGYTLRPGDAVKDGSVVSITPDALVARLNIFGQTTQVTLHLQRGE